MTLAQAQQAIYAALTPLQQVSGLTDLQVHGWLNANPTPPSIDIYPGDPFLDGGGFGSRDQWAYFTVRARVSTADQDAGQQRLLRLLDTGDPASVQAALEKTVGVVPDGGVTGFREYLDQPVDGGRLLGCEWRVQVEVSA